MTPTRQFRSRKPFRHAGGHELTLQSAKGPVRFLNPTQGLFKHSLPDATTPLPAEHAEARLSSDADVDPRKTATPPITANDHPSDVDGIHFLWRSRDNRKGRHPLRVQRPLPDGSEGGGRAQLNAPRPSSHPSEVLKGVVRTFTCFPVWDISWLVAFIFTAGSVVWVINGFFAWLPLVRPATEFKGEGNYGGGITAFIGAIVFFELGSLLLILEAINANDTGCFGWAVAELADQQTSHPSGKTFIASDKSCLHHHQNRHNLVGRPQHRVPGTDGDRGAAGAPRRHWRWRISWRDFREHYMYELGFLAGAAQLCGATIFGVAGVTALPGIADRLTPQWRLNAAYWIPQVVGGSGFIASGLLYMLETQSRWWRPAPRLLGWHIAFWNLIGAFGFTLCGALGMAYGNTGAQYQASLATFWGSWAFLIGSYLQLYESLNKHPVEEVKPKGKRALSPKLPNIQVAGS